MLPNSFCEASLTMIRKLNRDKRQVQISLQDERGCKIFNQNLHTGYKSMWFYPRCIQEAPCGLAGFKNLECIDLGGKRGGILEEFEGREGVGLIKIHEILSYKKQTKRLIHYINSKVVHYMETNR